ncbi:MAG: 8-amino-7-oxononanoate synthase, partial [Fusobacteriota bacterium]
MDRFESELLKLKKSNLYRKIKDINKIKNKYVFIKGEKFIDFSSNNYMGLKDNNEIKESAKKAIDIYGMGSTGSRLVTGTTALHKEFEEKIARFKSKERALIFNSGFDANYGVISSIMKKDDIIFSDKLNHASIIDGSLKSGARLIRYHHNDMKNLEKRLKKYRNKHKRALIITDSVFSMDGDCAKLDKLAQLKTKYDTLLMIDEAHGTGVLGKKGAGLASEMDLLDKIDINMGTLGKSFGLQGAYIASSSDIIEFLINNARSFIYTTAISPIIISGAITALELIKKGDFRRTKIREMSNYFRSELKKNGYNTGDSSTQIVPIIIGDNEETLKLSEKLYKNKILAPAIRYPTVPRGGSRIRFSINYNLDYEDLNKVIEIL